MLNRAWCFSITSPRSTTIFLGRKLGGFAGEMRMFESLAAQAEKRIASRIPWWHEVDVNLAIDSLGRGGHYEDPIAHVDRFINVVRDEKSFFFSD